MRYNNYHKHTHESNIKTLDCVVKPIDYITHSLNLGHNTYFSTEHGWTGKYMQNYDLCQKYDLKFIYGVEAYIVQNRFEKDKSNAHIVIIALNRFGFEQLNIMLSEANKTGFYYKTRIDLELLLKLNPDDFIVTTACLGGIANIKYGLDFITPIHNHFKSNFYLEIQNHQSEEQKKLNLRLLKLSIDSKIELIHANDSHYINESDSKYRDLFLKGKGMFYSDEDGFKLDYPDYYTIISRYKKQGVLSLETINRAIKNTLIFDSCENLNFNKEIKMPAYKCKDTTKELKKILNKRYKESNDRDLSRNKEYIKNINYELDIITNTNMQDYFLYNTEIIRVAVEEFGLILTRTGRGSCVSFYLNKLLGFTEIDRLVSPITLYPTRFMSIERILSTKSLPDIDFNCANVEPVVRASKKILGEDGIYQMIAFGTMQRSEAFRNMCRALNLDLDSYNEVAKDLDLYGDDPVWKDIIESSKVFIGTIDKISPAPCSYLMLDKSISKEIGLLRVNNLICCAMDGMTAEIFKYLKNDFLTVKVWFIISETFKLLNKPIPNIKTLESLLDEKVWLLYENGLTATLNQVETDLSTGLVKQYKPKNVAELSAFVASIRPGFASLVSKFISREYHTTGIQELDELLEDSYHYMLYQESIMKFLIWCGIEESETYDIIKKISKKKFKENELFELKTKLIKGFEQKTNDVDKFGEIWQVVEDAASYSFNASHSLSVAYDSLYQAYLKANFPLEYFTVCLNTFKDDLEKTNKIINELESFGIKLFSVDFYHCSDDYTFDKNTNTIYRSVLSIKGFGEKTNISYIINKYNKQKYTNFVDLLYDLVGSGLMQSKIIILIKLSFFKMFGDINYLLEIVNVYNLFSNCRNLSKEKLEKNNIDESIIKKYFKKETEKSYIDSISNIDMIKELCNKITYNNCTIIDIIKYEILYYDMIVSTFKVNKSIYFVQDIVGKKSKYIKCYNLKTGRIYNYKLNYKVIFNSKKTMYNYNNSIINKNTLIKINKLEEQDKMMLVDNKWIPSGEKIQTIMSFNTLTDEFKLCK